MILNDRLITQYCTEQHMIEPFDPQRVNPASYDLTLSTKIIEITPGGIMDASNTGNATRQLTSQRTITLQYGQTYLLQPGVFILASSSEYVKIPPELAAEVKLKSTTARRGIGHVYSGWIDPGFHGQITFELFSHVPVLLEPGKPIAQIIFSQMAEVPEKPYFGRYQHQVGPTTARQYDTQDLWLTSPTQQQSIAHPINNDIITLEGTVIPAGVDQVWGDVGGNVHVKTPDGQEYTLTAESILKATQGGMAIREVILHFVDNIVNPKTLKSSLKTMRDANGRYLGKERQQPNMVDMDWSDDL